MNTQYIFITNSGKLPFGEGILAASLASTLLWRGYNVNIAKYDNYLNSDAASFDAYPHFECFTTDDGHEADFCLGHYERIAGIKTSKHNHITAGQIMQNVINNERRGAYRREKVTAAAHVTEEIERCVTRLANNGNIDIVIIEVGGTLHEAMSDIMLCTISKMQRDLGHSCLCIDCYADSDNHSLLFDNLGIRTDFTITCNSDVETLSQRCDALSLVSLEFNGNIYETPLSIANCRLDEMVLEKLTLKPVSNSNNDAWKSFVAKSHNAQNLLTIAIIGNLGNNEKAYVNLNEAVKICGWHNNTNVELKHVPSNKLHSGNIEELLHDADALIAAPGIAANGIEGYIEAIRWSRTNNKPTLGIALGMHCMVIDIARNVLGLADANTTEVNTNATHNVVDIMIEQKQMAYMPESIRLGAYPCQLTRSSLAGKAYGSSSVQERHRHRFEFNNQYRDLMQQSGVIFSGILPNAGLVEVIEMANNFWHIGCNFQPELTCSALLPNKLLTAFIIAAICNKEKRN